MKPSTASSAGSVATEAASLAVSLPLLPLLTWLLPPLPELKLNWLAWVVAHDWELLPLELLDPWLLDGPEGVVGRLEEGPLAGDPSSPVLTTGFVF